MPATFNSRLQLPFIPNLGRLMLQAVFKKAHVGQTPVLPNQHVCVENVFLDKRKVNDFNGVVDWDQEIALLHPCYLHTLAFPLHLTLLLGPDSPFSLLGLVHIGNEIRQFYPLYTAQEYQFNCYFGEVTLHPRGWQFTIVTDVYSGDELVWQSTSTNLFRVDHGMACNIAKPNFVLNSKLATSVDWRLTGDLGRRYASVSGDYNPIHLNSITAKLFGFKRHIAHGMWTKSRCLSKIMRQPPDISANAFSVNVDFIKPIFLPGQVNMLLQNSSHDKTEVLFKVETPMPNIESLPNLIGEIRCS